MRVWQVVVLLNLALALGAGGGYLWWGRQTAQLQQELAVARAAAARAAVEREFKGEGVVRAVLPELNVLVITHGEIAGLMPPMTMGFRVASPALYDSIEVGDPVRFVLRGVPPTVTLTGIEKISP
jgi:Cu(I)/Ag(I) efflux system protein CusF